MARDSNDQVQQMQEIEYAFPYHHLLERYPYVTICKSWGGALKYLFTQDLLFEHLDKIQFSSIVDIGCGDGKVTKEIARRYSEKRVCGIDYSEQAISLARLLVSQANFYSHDILRQSFQSKFDVGCSIEVIEHIPTDLLPKFVDAMADMLNTDGYLILSTPHRNLPLTDKHYQHFSHNSIIELVSSRFEIIAIEHINRSSTHVSRLISRILHNRLFTMTNPRIVTRLYFALRKQLQLTDERNATGLFVVLKKTR